MHDSAPIFVPAATFGQLTEATHGTNANTRAGKPRATLWFWETDYDYGASLGNLIQVRQQLDLIMVRAQDVGFQQVIVFNGQLLFAFLSSIFAASGQRFDQSVRIATNALVGIWARSFSHFFTRSSDKV
jgi:hypothetical protein